MGKKANKKVLGKVVERFTMTSFNEGLMHIVRPKDKPKVRKAPGFGRPKRQDPAFEVDPSLKDRAGHDAWVKVMTIIRPIDGSEKFNRIVAVVPNTERWHDGEEYFTVSFDKKYRICESGDYPIDKIGGREIDLFLRQLDWHGIKNPVWI